MEDKTHEPRKILYSIKRIESLIDSALEHASHGWNALEKETKVNRVNPDSWPPVVEAPVGSAQYHLATMISYIFEAYNSLSDELDRQKEMIELVNKRLSNKKS